MLQAAIRETVNMIANMNDVVVTLEYATRTTNSYVYPRMISKFNCYVTLRESRSLVALKLLRNSTLETPLYYNSSYKYDYKSISLFSRTMSKKLNAPIYADISSWQMQESMQRPTSKPLSSPSSRTSSDPSSKLKVISLVSAHLHSS